MKAFCFLKIQLLARTALPTFSSPYSLHQKNIWSALLAHRARDVWHKWRTNTCRIQSLVTQWTPPPLNTVSNPNGSSCFPCLQAAWLLCQPQLLAHIRSCIQQILTLKPMDTMLAQDPYCCTISFSSGPQIRSSFAREKSRVLILSFWRLSTFKISVILLYGRL